VNSAEENRAKFYKFLDGKPLFSALYGMYMITLKELQAVLKVNSQTGRSVAVNKTSVETTQDYDFQEIKRRRRRVFNDASETTMKSTKSVPISTTVKQTPKAVRTRHYFAPLRTNDMDMRDYRHREDPNGAGGSQKIR
jgi:hypothetical protein